MLYESLSLLVLSIAASEAANAPAIATLKTPAVTSLIFMFASSFL